MFPHPRHSFRQWVAPMDSSQSILSISAILANYSRLQRKRNENWSAQNLLSQQKQSATVIQGFLSQRQLSHFHPEDKQFVRSAQFKRRNSDTARPM